MREPLDIALVRVDNRLVHGQILEGWLPFLEASCIVVVDDQVASDVFRETVIRMAVPSGVRVIVSGVTEFASNYAFGKGTGPTTIVLFRTVPDARRAFGLGFRFDRLNVGNVYNEECRLCCTQSVQLSDGDIRDIADLGDAGVQVALQRVPRDKTIDFVEVVRNLGPSRVADPAGSV